MIYVIISCLLQATDKQSIQSQEDVAILRG